MNHWLAQLVLAAQNSNEEHGWAQILFFVIVAIFYVLGSIAKARASKAAPKLEKQTPRKPVRKRPEPTAELQILKQFFGLPEEEAESGIQLIPEEPEPQVVRPPVRKVARPVISQAVKPQVVEPQIQPKIEKVPEIAVVAPQVETVVPVETSQVKYLSEILSDYENPDSLRRAILHYEILGKPLALREQAMRGY
jgi:hypothetical protein